MYSGHGRLCACLSLAAFPHYCTDPNVTWGNRRVRIRRRRVALLRNSSCDFLQLKETKSLECALESYWLTQTMTRDSVTNCTPFLIRLISRSRLNLAMSAWLSTVDRCKCPTVWTQIRSAMRLWLVGGQRGSWQLQFARTLSDPAFFSHAFSILYFFKHRPMVPHFLSRIFRSHSFSFCHATTSAALLVGETIRIPHKTTEEETPTATTAVSLLPYFSAVCV